MARVIRRHELDRSHGFVLQPRLLAGIGGGRVALLGGAADVIVSDWLFVGIERAHGVDLNFSPFSSAAGALVLARGSDARSARDLVGRRLGVAGGEYDKSWMIVRAAIRQQNGIDLARAARVVYAAPPLLSAKLEQGELDAVLTFWNFAAALQVAGFRPLLTVAASARALGLSGHPPLLGYVFRQGWASRNPHLIAGFLAACGDAENILAHSDAEWNAIRPLMNAPDDRVFARLKAGFRAGIVPASTPATEQEVARLFTILHDLGGSAATGGLTRLPSGVFWPAPR
ncbi:MAG: ABC transporter substrate-binding protein [Rhodospirillales bacterium]|nr:ABC transporter substrate-binding protein [Rhodospirillales bacterium]